MDYWKRQAFYEDVVRFFEVLESQSLKANSINRESLDWLQRPTFAFKTLFGFDLHCPQPSGFLTNDSSVCKY